MHNLNTSTIAALEEMLQNIARTPPADYLPIHFQGGMHAQANGEVIGHINPEFSHFLQESLKKEPIANVRIDSHHLTIAAAPPSDLSRSWTELAQRMRAGGFIPGWRNEDFSWIDQNGHAYFHLERAAFRTFGLRSTATHINGFTATGTLWLGRRSQNKATDPGLLDNLAAGGISADETPWVCARRELWEEAGVPQQISEHIQPVGRMHMRRISSERGFHDEQLYIYDLKLAENFVPTNHDGEVSSFIEISISEAAARILADEFTKDAGFVTADFILRNAR